MNQIDSVFVLNFHFLFVIVLDFLSIKSITVFI